MSKQYDEYLFNHIQAVKACYKLLRGKGIELTDHDLSKYTEEEYLPYDDYFYPETHQLRTGGDVTNDRFKYAWLHHQNTNPHHWQYWVLINDDDGIEALAMPKEYLLEMVADWGSFAFQKKDGSELLKWYESHKDKMILHEYTRREVEKLVPRLARLIDEHF